MKVTEKPVEPKKEKVLEIAESEFIEIVTESGREVLRTFKNKGDDTPELALLLTLLCADLSATITSRLFNGEE